IALIKSRAAARAESGQRGFITMQVLALTVLMLVAAGGLVAVAQSTIHTSREARDFTQARRTADYAQTIMSTLQDFGVGPFNYTPANNNLTSTNLGPVTNG